MNDFIKQQISQIAGDSNVRFNEDMSKHTTFRVGGAAEVFAEPDSAETLSRLVWYLNNVQQDYFILGNGSNLLVSDKGYSGTVICMGSRFSSVEISGNTIKAGAGAMLSGVARMAGEASLSGMEFASGIPGSAGGAVVMNAGAYGGDISQILKEAEAVAANGNMITLTNGELKFGYRDSICRREKLTVISATFELADGNRDMIEARMNELAQQRRMKQPLEYPSAGSTFKRPEGYFAGKLIMDAGLSGMTIGGAKVSEKHCGFIINTGKATAADIYDCINEVRDKVKQRFNVELEPEVCMLGEF